MPYKSAWIFYLLGAFLTLVWKLIRYVRHEKRNGIPARDAIAEWFFEDSAENSVSWLVTIGFVWCFGAIYVDLRDRAGVFSFIQTVPLHNSVAFFLGGVLELVAPKAAEQICTWVISHLPGGGG